MRALLAVVFAVGCSSSASRQALHNQGGVTLASQGTAQTGGSGSIAANFLRDQLDPYLGCSQKNFGACTAHVDCSTVGTPPITDGGATPYASAGAIAVTGLSMPVTLTVMTMGMFPGQYTVFQQFTPLFKGGESLSIGADGGEVPAFSAQLIAPSQPTLNMPSPASLAHVPRDQDLAFAWSGGSGQLRLSLQGAAPPPAKGAAGFDCSFDLSAGGGSIPSAALQAIGPGSATLGVTAVSMQTLSDGNWQLEVAATNTPRLPDGSTISAVVLTLE